jgi:hypothetical protein
MTCFAELARERHPACRELTMNVHQMSIFADILSSGDNVPEGIRQDGADLTGKQESLGTSSRQMMPARGKKKHSGRGLGR